MNRSKIFRKSGLSMLMIALFGMLSGSYVFANNPEAPTTFRSSDVTITVTGTSTVHDWEMISEEASSEALFTVNDEGEPIDLESVSFKLNKTSLKSDKSGLDRRAYDALNASDYPEIIFSTDNGDVQQSGSNLKVNSTGELSIAGVTRKVDVNASCVNGDGAKLVCTGSQTLKMSDFDIDPPVMMLGTLRTGDEITIDYRIVYTP